MRQFLRKKLFVFVTDREWFNDTDEDDENTQQRSRPRIIWKHSWEVDQMRAALLESSFSSIPNEIFFQIFQLLSIRDLGKVSLVCRFFKTIASQDEIWQSKCGSAYRLFTLHSPLTPNFYEKIASHRLSSKSFKEIYMNWIYEKYLRNQSRRRAKFYFEWCICCHSYTYWRYSELRLLSWCPVRSTRKTGSTSVFGFNPDSSQYM